MKKSETETIQVNEKIIIQDISIERILVNIAIKTGNSSCKRFAISLLQEKGEQYEIQRLIYLEPESIKGNVCFFCINLSCIDSGCFLENGQWEVLAIDEEDKKYFCQCEEKLAYKTWELDHIYNYRMKYAYNLSFRIRMENRNIPVVYIKSFFLKENPKWKNTSKPICLDSLKLIVMQAIYNVAEKSRHKNSKRILYLTEGRHCIGDNLKAIDDRMRERGLYPEYTPSYMLNITSSNRHNKIKWVKTILAFAKQDIIFVDNYVRIFNVVHLSKRTKFIQVWHAGEGFKAVGYSRFGHNFGPNWSPHPVISVHKNYDYAIVRSERQRKVYSEVYGISMDKVLPLGMPRLDGFLDEERIKKQQQYIYEKYPNLQNKKLILFCPTFRIDRNEIGTYDYSQLDLKKIYDFTKKEGYIWAFKMHPSIENKPVIPAEYRDRIIDLTDREDTRDLLYVTDVMITDYSSIYYDYALLNKPILFFIYDRIEYEFSNGIQKSVKENAPGKVCETFKELMEALRTGDYEFEKTQKFRETEFKDFDNNAADRIIDNLILGKG